MRNIGDVIERVKYHVPVNVDGLYELKDADCIDRMDKIAIEASFTAPEVMSYKWKDLHEVILELVDDITEEWHLHVLSEFTGRPLEDVHSDFLTALSKREHLQRAGTIDTVFEINKGDRIAILGSYLGGRMALGLAVLVDRLLKGDSVGLIVDEMGHKEVMDYITSLIKYTLTSQNRPCSPESISEKVSGKITFYNGFRGFESAMKRGNAENTSVVLINQFFPNDTDKIMNLYELQEYRLSKAVNYSRELGMTTVCITQLESIDKSRQFRNILSQFSALLLVSKEKNDFYVSDLELDGTQGKGHLFYSVKREV